MYNEILSKIRTGMDAWRLEQEVDLLLKNFYSSDPKKFDLTLDKNIRSWVSTELKSAFSQGGIDKDKYLEGLKTEIHELKKLKLTLAYEPTQSSLEHIHDWVKANVGTGVILEITINPTLVAGAIVAYEGEYRDLSLRKRFAQGFEKSRKRISEILSM